MNFMKFRQNCITKIVILVFTTTVTLLTFAILAFSTELLAKELQEYEYPTNGYVRLSSHKLRLDVHEEPSGTSNVVDELKPGKIVFIVGEEKGYYEIIGIDYIGYVTKNFVVIPERNSENRKLISASVITANSSSENRNYNMALACFLLDGLILEPGEQFDWYGINGVGPATKENGFREANVIENGKYVKGYGGGVCQVSTALYNSIYDLGIEPYEIHHHSKPSSYVETNMDATVDYLTSKSLKFTNTMDYSIEIQAFTNESQVIMLIYKKL